MSKEKIPKSRPARSVKSGLEKIAFGGINDAVSLLFTEESDIEALKNMDFYNVSEIKRQNGGGIEIKFYDRMEAMKCLKELEEKGESNSPLYRALEKCAKSFDKENGDGA